ncbi:LAGLIDADG family homing endonuclease [Escherichia coli]
MRSLLFKEYGLEYEKAAGKQVPLSVRRANSEVEAALIDAYPGLTNIMNGAGSNEFGAASGLLLQQIRLMLLNLGIMSTISEKHVRVDSNISTRLSFSGSNHNISS